MVLKAHLTLLFFAGLSCVNGSLPSAASSPGRAHASAAAAGVARIRSRGAARARARPRRQNLARVSPQSTGLSCPVSDLTQRLATGALSYHDSFGRCPPTFGPPGASATLPAMSSWAPVRATVRSRSTTYSTRLVHRYLMHSHYFGFVLQILRVPAVYSEYFAVLYYTYCGCLRARRSSGFAT